MNAIAQIEVREAPVDLGISIDPTIVKTGGFVLLLFVATLFMGEGGGSERRKLAHARKGGRVDEKAAKKKGFEQIAEKKHNKVTLCTQSVHNH